jgi:hypothetical protein
MDVAIGGLLASAVAVVAEARGHTVGLVVRTVRAAGDAPAAGVGAVAAFATIAVLGLAPRRRESSWKLLAWPVLVAAAALVAGHVEAVRVAAGATPSLTMAERSAVLSLALVRCAAFFAFGALAASTLLALAALVAAWGARPSVTLRGGGRRFASLSIGIAAIVAVAAELATRGRATGWIGASPAAAGVAAVFFASSGIGGIAIGQRRAAARGILQVALLSSAAVACTAAARGLAGAVGLGDEGPTPEDWTQVVALMRGRLLFEAGAAAWFLAPVWLSVLVVLPPRERVALSPLLAPAAAAVATVGVACSAPVSLRTPARALLALRPTLTPPDVALPPTTLAGDCGPLQEDRVVFLGARRIHVGESDFGEASLLDDPAACASFVDAQLEGHRETWLAVDGSATFGRMGCLLGPLSTKRGEAIRPGSTGRRLPYTTRQGETSCSLRWLARDSASGAARCPLLSLAHRWCHEFRPDPEERVWPDPVLDVVMEEGAAFRLRMVRDTAVVDVREAPRALEHDDAGHPVFPELREAVAVEWRQMGEHFSEMDKKVDFAVVHAAPTTAIPEVLAAVEAIEATKRPIVLPERIVHVPAYDVAVALLEPPRLHASLEETEPGPGVPKVELVTTSPEAPQGPLAVVAAHLGALRSCAARATVLPSMAAVSFSVDREGFAIVSQLRAVVPKGETAPAIEAGLDACLRLAFDSMEFDPASARGTYSASLRFGP